MRILVVNAGSSSLKLRLLEDDALIASTDLASPRGQIDLEQATGWVRGCGGVDGVGHRIVHGGVEFTQPVLVDGGVRERLQALVDLAPLHQPKSLAALDAVTAMLPDVPAIACFDTAFHASISAAAATYALPEHWRRRWDLKRYGFHGLSHSYASRRAAVLLGRSTDQLRVVTCHLGSGASLAAVRHGRSVDTTMGFTPLEGLVMATRSGSVDPGLLLWLAQHAGTPPAELAATLEHRSGLLGLGGSADMRIILERAGDGDAEAKLALDVYIHRLRGSIAAMAAAMDGIDAIVFTGGVGERSSQVRALAGEGLAFLGVAIDPVRNEGGEGDRDISTDGAATATLVVEAREDIEIAQQARQALAPSA